MGYKKKIDDYAKDERGAFHSFEKAYEIFSEQRDFYGFLMDFSCKQNDSCQRRTRFFGVKCPFKVSLRAGTPQCDEEQQQICAKLRNIC